MDLSNTRTAIQRGIDEGAHVGALLHARRGDDVVADLAMGMARPGVDMAPDTLMPWFSVTKVITAIAVVQLWDRGQLALDDVTRDGATIRALLTHTAGGRVGYDPRDGFIVLGEVITATDGRSYEQYVNEEVLEPLDLADTWVAMDEHRYTAYGDRMGVMYNTTDPRAPVPIDGLMNAAAYAKAQPSRSAVGPVSDMSKLLAALRDGGNEVLSRQAVEAMTARHRAGLVDETFGQIIDWGLGVMVNSWHYRKRPASYGYGDYAGWRAFGHGGAESSLAFADPEHDLAVGIICNGMPGEARNHRRTQRIVNALYKDLGLAS